MSLIQVLPFLSVTASCRFRFLTLFPSGMFVKTGTNDPVRSFISHNPLRQGKHQVLPFKNSTLFMNVAGRFELSVKLLKTTLSRPVATSNFKTPELVDSQYSRSLRRLILIMAR